MTHDRTPRTVPELPPGYWIDPSGTINTPSGRVVIHIDHQVSRAETAWLHYGRARYATGDVREQMIRAAEAALDWVCPTCFDRTCTDAMHNAARIVDALLANREGPSREWLEKAAANEDGHEISVGGLASDLGLLAKEASGEGNEAANGTRSERTDPQAGGPPDSDPSATRFNTLQVDPASQAANPSLPATDLPPGYTTKQDGYGSWHLLSPIGARIAIRTFESQCEQIAWAHYGRSLHASLAEREQRARAEGMRMGWQHANEEEHDRDACPLCYLERKGEPVDLATLNSISRVHCSPAPAALQSGADGSIAESKETGK